MQKVTIAFEFTDIKDFRQKGQGKMYERVTYIELNDGGKLFVTGQKGVKLYKQLCRNHSGEHLD